MRFPLDLCRLTRGFDFKSSLYVGGMHAAADFIDPTGTLGKPVRAVADGTATPHPLDHYSGLWVSVDHPTGWRSQYRHFSQHVLTGPTPVKEGDTIGLAGSTGVSTGPHVHFDLWHKQKQDPSAFFKVGWWAHDPMLYLGKEEDDMFTDTDRELLAAIADRLIVVDTQLDTVDQQLDTLESALLADSTGDKATDNRRIIKIGTTVKKIDDGL